MGWARGVVDGKEVGYGVADVCNHSECSVEIDRGMAYACGGYPGEDEGCDGFFCSDHLYWSFEAGQFICKDCLMLVDAHE